MWRKVNIKLKFVFSIDLPSTSDKLLIKEPIQKMSIGSAIINLAYLLLCSVSAPPRTESVILVVIRPRSKDKLDLELLKVLWSSARKSGFILKTFRELMSQVRLSLVV